MATEMCYGQTHRHTIVKQYTPSSLSFRSIRSHKNEKIYIFRNRNVKIEVKTHFTAKYFYTQPQFTKITYGQEHIIKSKLFLKVSSALF